MFVRSRIDNPLTFRKNGKSWTLKPHAVTLIDDPTVTASEIKGCYGSRVEVISDEVTFTSPNVGRQIHRNIVQSKVEPKKLTIVGEKVKTLDDILEEVNQELDSSNDNQEVDNTENNEVVQDAVVGGTDDNIPEAKGQEVLNNDADNDGVSETKEKQKKTTKKPVKRATKKPAKKNTKKSTKTVKKSK